MSENSQTPGGDPQGNQGSQGPQGIQGTQGIQGQQGLQGIQGEKGDNGAPGAPGKDGAKGDTGKRGSIWITLTRDPAPTDGQPGDFFINSTNNNYWHKANETLWTPAGHLGGGDVVDAPRNNKKYVRSNGKWFELPTLLAEAPKDNGSYVRRNGEWVAVDDALDASSLKSGAIEDVIDVAAQQVFSVNAVDTPVLRFENLPPVGRAKRILVLVNGNNGIVTWPDSVQWSGNVQPALGAEWTVVELLCDGHVVRGGATWSV